jgi:alpha-N-arabinofuranosidase
VPGQVPLPELSGSASIKGKTLTLTLVHVRHDTQSERTIRLRGASAKAVRTTVLTNTDLHAHNTFDAPRTLEPRSEVLTATGSEFTVRIASASVTKLEIELV